jgi:hypothetical protein
MTPEQETKLNEVHAALPMLTKIHEMLTNLTGILEESFDRNEIRRHGMSIAAMGRQHAELESRVAHLEIEQHSRPSSNPPEGG